MKAPPSSPVPPDRTCSDILSAEELPPASVKSMVSNVEKIRQSNPPKSPLLKAGYGVSDAASRYFFARRCFSTRGAPDFCARRSAKAS